MICALIKDGLVAGVVRLEAEQIPVFGPYYEQIIDVTDYSPLPQIGWGFDGKNISGSTMSRKISRLAMNQRFTVSEMLGLMTYVNANPTSIVALLMQRLQMATFVDLSRSDTQGGVYLLASPPFNIITMARAQEILTAVPRIEEVYNP